MAIKFDSDKVYYITAELPYTKKTINIMYIKNRDEWEKYSTMYKIYFSKLFLLEYDKKREFKERVRRVSCRSNDTFKKRIVIPRIKRTRKKPIKGNLCVSRTDTIAYIQVSHNKTRRILKIDIEDLPKLESVCKNSFYFINRPLKKYSSNYVLSKKKSRKHCIYSYIFERKINTDVLHLDGDYTNYCKSNLKILNSGHSITINKAIKLQNETTYEKNASELVGYTKNRDGYYARVIVNGKRINIGRSKDIETSAKLYDIGRIYYLGKGFSINYPFDYYFTFEHELMAKTIKSLEKRNNGLKTALAQDLINYFIED